MGIGRNIKIWKKAIHSGVRVARRLSTEKKDMSRLICTIPRSGYSMIAAIINSCECELLGIDGKIFITNKSYLNYFKEHLQSADERSYFRTYPAKVYHSHLPLNKVLIPISSDKNRIVIMMRDGFGYTKSVLRHLILDKGLSDQYSDRLGMKEYDRLKKIYNPIEYYIKFNNSLSQFLEEKKRGNYELRIHYTKDPKTIDKEKFVHTLNDFFSLGYSDEIITKACGYLDQERVKKYSSASSVKFSNSSFSFTPELEEYIIDQLSKSNETLENIYSQFPFYKNQ